MRYIGSFRNINEQLYTIEIITNNDVTVTQQITLGNNPILTEMENGDNIFKEVKYQAATIRIITNTVHFDIYSSIAKGTKITLYDENNNVKWVGYATPNMYNQDYTFNQEYLDIDAIDGLSILQYIEYNSADKNFTTFTQLLNDIISKCDCYQYFYLPTSIQENETKHENIFDCISISKANFFDDKNEGWKCNEILEEVCKYMGVTAVAQGTTVFFLDYEALKNNGNVSYWKIPINQIDKEYEVFTKLTTPINASSYSASKTQISLGETYNKIKVVDSLYQVDDLMPSLEDKKLLTNKNITDWYEYRKIPYTPNQVYYDAFYKFYDHPNFECRHYYSSAYVSDKWAIDWDANVKTYDDLDYYIGGNIMKVASHKEEKDNKLIPSLDWQTYIYLCMNNSQFVPQQIPPLPTNVIRKFLVVNIDKEVALNNRESYIIIDGSVNFCTKNLHCPITGEEANGNDSFNKENLYIEAILEYNGKYFSNANTDNMDGGEWVDTETPFKIYLDANDTETESLFNKGWNFKSNIDFTMGITETQGYAIKLPSYPVTTKAPKLTFIGLRQELLNKPHQIDRPITGIWISGFSIKSEIGYSNSYDKESEDTDTSYENVINENYVNDFDEEEFKICTWDDKKANYSAVVYDNGTERKYLDKIYNTVTKDYGRCEENFIKRYIRQYSQPPLIMDMSSYNNYNCYNLLYSKLFNNKTTYFIIDKMRIDWKNNTTDVKLNELK